MINKLTTAFAVFMLFFTNACAQQPGENDITVQLLKEKMKSDSTLIILDVRMPHELTGELGQIEGVINIPVQELEKE